MVRKALILGELDNTATGAKPGETLTKITAIKGVKEAEYITGPYDFYLTVQAETREELSKIVTTLRETKGIKETMTCLVLSPKTKKQPHNPQTGK